MIAACLDAGALWIILLVLLIALVVLAIVRRF